MMLNAFIVDGFYDNPDEVRAFALAQDFNVKGNFPGARTKSFNNDSVFSVLQSIVGPHAGKINYFPEDYNGAYQITTARDRSWIHADNGTKWAGVVYLTPNAPLSSGTGFFKHKASGLTWSADGKGDWNDDSQDMTKWELTSSVGNLYNRLILYRGKQFHSSLDYFGNSLENGRLFQTFFFSTEQ
jgi:hypothetical protein